MFRKVLLALAIIATLALASCTGSTTPQPTETATPISTPSATTTETTVTIDDEKWTCKDVVDTSSSECNKLMQQAFDDYSWNFDRYFTYGNLDKLKAQKGITSKDIAYVGLVACAIMTGVPQHKDYLPALTDDERFKALTSPEPALNDAWVAAEEWLCFTREDVENS